MIKKVGALLVILILAIFLLTTNIFAANTSSNETNISNSTSSSKTNSLNTTSNTNVSKQSSNIEDELDSVSSDSSNVSDVTSSFNSDTLFIFYIFLSCHLPTKLIIRSFTNYPNLRKPLSIRSS